MDNNFRQNFADGWEREGAAFAVYQNGKLVVDLWGGYADEYAMRQWKRDTLTNSFSTTKVCQLVVDIISSLINQGIGLLVCCKMC